MEAVSVEGTNVCESCVALQEQIAELNQKISSLQAEEVHVREAYKLKLAELEDLTARSLQAMDEAIGAAEQERDQRILDEEFRRQRLDVDKMREASDRRKKTYQAQEARLRNLVDNAQLEAKRQISGYKDMADRLTVQIEECYEMPKRVRDRVKALIRFIDVTRKAMTPADMITEIRKGLVGIEEVSGE